MGQTFSGYTSISHLEPVRRESQRLSHLFSSDEYIDASRWCVTREDLDFFESEVRKLWMEGKMPENPAYPNPHHWDPQVGPNIHQVTLHYIIPASEEGVSWALTRHPEGLKCDVFASHCWSEGVFEFITAVRQAWPSDLHHLYCCFLSNPQGGDDLVEAVLGSDIRHSPFYRALKTAKVLMVIPNKHVSIYSRLWCVFEAYTAIRTGVQVRLPLRVPRGRLVVSISFSFLLFLCSTCIGLFFTSPALGIILGPLTWLILAHMLADVAKLLRNKTSVLSCPWIAWSVVRMVIVGQGVGLSLSKIVGFSKGNLFAGTFSHNYSKDEGSSIAVLFITAALVCAYLYDLIVALRRIAIAHEGFQLDFSTVQNASCSSTQDQMRIMEEIRHEIEDIDQAIHTLMRVGRYDREVERDLEFGLPEWLLRDGINPFRPILACLTWQYWWLFDLWDNHLYTLTFEVPLLTCILSLSLVHVIGQRTSFVVESLLAGGMVFDCVTVFISWRSARSKTAFKHDHMQLRFFWYHCSGLLIVFIANLVRYGVCGIWKTKRRAGNEGESQPSIVKSVSLPEDTAIELVYSTYSSDVLTRRSASNVGH